MASVHMGMPRTGGLPQTTRAEAVENFSRISRVVDNRDQLREAFCRAVWQLGFDHFALQGEGARLLLADLPTNWIFRPDPMRDLVFMAATRSLSPFLWSDIPRLTTLNAADLRQLEDAPPGFAVPIHLVSHFSGLEMPSRLTEVSDFFGCCSFIMSQDGELPVDSFAAACYISGLALDAVLRMNLVQPSRLRLTPRQRDCMLLAARGKSDWEIGHVLGISETTVHKHIEAAKQRFGVSTRIQLVVRGLAEGWLGFPDIIDEKV